MAQQHKKRIIIVDDHPVMRKGLADTLDAEIGFEVVGQFKVGEDLLQNYEKLKPDLIIIDISLPGMSGLELIKHLKARSPEIKILVISRHDESLYAERAIRAGAQGYLMKLEAGEVMIKAIRKIFNGKIYVSDEISEKLLMNLAAGNKDMNMSPIDSLSDRELEVFELTGKGDSTRAIAEKLHLSVKTVESYRARIKKKLNFDNATELMRHAVKWVENENTYFE
ncbi:MAG TPA: response regulator transcription factor [Balneolaceae bacterium]|nr:response regulator transcription factor [Balneolaceae bacterium]